jgi:hypothetical protein
VKDLTTIVKLIIVTLLEVQQQQSTSQAAAVTFEAQTIFCPNLKALILKKKTNRSTVASSSLTMLSALQFVL